MAYAPGLPKNWPKEGVVVVISDLTMANEITKLRSRAVLLVARSDIKYLGITTGEVQLAISSKLHMQRYKARVTRHQPEDFLVIFDCPPQWDLAIRASMVRVRGIDFDVLPWTEYDHGRDSTWWYHV